MKDISEVIYCKYCGKKIKHAKSYCSKCGKSIIDNNKEHCLKCGSVIDEHQAFCDKCGFRIGKKKVKSIYIILIILVLLVVVGGVLWGVKKYVLDNSSSVEKYLSNGDYLNAYNGANEIKKKEILLENLITTMCLEIRSDLINEESFGLVNGWYDSSKKIVLKVQGTNSLGAVVSTYFYYKYDEKEQKFKFVLETEDFSYKDVNLNDMDYWEKTEYNSNLSYLIKIINNDDYKINAKIVNNINQLHEKGLLDSVIMLDNVVDIYP